MSVARSGVRVRPSRDLAAREARNQRVAYLARPPRSWSLREIGREVDLSPEQVRRILAEQRRRDAEAGVGTASIVEQLGAAIVDKARAVNLVRRLERQLQDALDEAQSAEIDRMAGLA